jgi:hypothetical protein
MDRIYLHARNTLRTEVSDQRATHRAVGLSGLVVVALFGVGNALWSIDIPRTGAPAREILDFYSGRSTRIVVGASLSLVAIGVFAYFGAALRTLLTQLEGDDVLGTTALAGVVLAGAAGLGAETINMVGAQRAGDGELNPELGRSLFEISQVLGFEAAGVGLGVLALAIAAVALRRGALAPRWLALVFAVIGVALLTPLARYAFPPGILALGVICALIYRGADRPA